MLQKIDSPQHRAAVAKAVAMARPRDGRRAVRVTAQLDWDVHAQLCDVGRRQDVSVAWLIRRAVAEYLAGQAQEGTLPLPLHRAGSLGGES